VDAADRAAGHITLDQIVGDLAELRRLGAKKAVLDPYNDDPDETLRPGIARDLLAAVRDQLTERQVHDVRARYR
jgi:hypothetical protein